MVQLESFQRYLTVEKRYSKHTIQAYIADITQFTDFYSSLHHTGLESFEAVLYSDVRKWVMSLLQQSITERSVHRKISALRRLYKFLRLNGFVQNDPTVKIQLPKFSKALPEVFTAAEFNQCFQQYFEPLPDSYWKTQDILMLSILLSTGLRVSEVCNLEERMIRSYGQGGELRILGKGKKERIIPISVELLHAIQEFIILRKQQAEIEASGVLFKTASNTPMYSKYVYRLCNAVLAPLWKMKQRSPHSFRHAFATGMLNAGADLLVIKTLLGHSSLAATQVYTKTSIDHLLQVYKQAFPKA